MARWFLHLKRWAPKQNRVFPELIKHGHVTIGKVTYVSSFEMATDYVNGRLPSDGTFEKPSNLLYVRPPNVTAIYALIGAAHAELTAATLPSHLCVSPAQIETVRIAVFA